MHPDASFYSVLQLRIEACKDFIYKGSVFNLVQQIATMYVCMCVCIRNYCRLDANLNEMAAVQVKWSLIFEAFAK